MGAVSSAGEAGGQAMRRLAAELAILTRVRLYWVPCPEHAWCCCVRVDKYVVSSAGANARNGGLAAAHRPPDGQL